MGESVCVPQRQTCVICDGILVMFTWQSAGTGLVISSMRLHLSFFFPHTHVTLFPFDNHSLSIEPTDNKHCQPGTSQRQCNHIRDYSICDKWSSTDFAGHIALESVRLSQTLCLPFWSYWIEQGGSHRPPTCQPPPLTKITQNLCINVYMFMCFSGFH